MKCQKWWLLHFLCMSYSIFETYYSIISLTFIKISLKTSSISKRCETLIQNNRVSVVYGRRTPTACLPRGWINALCDQVQVWAINIKIFRVLISPSMWHLGERVRQVPHHKLQSIIEIKRSHCHPSSHVLNSQRIKKNFITGELGFFRLVLESHNRCKIW